MHYTGFLQNLLTLIHQYLDFFVIVAFFSPVLLLFLIYLLINYFSCLFGGEGVIFCETEKGEADSKGK